MKQKITAKNKQSISRLIPLLIIVGIVSTIGVRLLISSHAATPGYLYASGTKLMLNGQPYYDAGVMSFPLTGCGANQGETPSAAQLDQFMAGLPPHTLIRTWAYSNMEGSIAPVVAAAQKYNQLLIMSLTDGNTACGDSPNKDAAWYQSGWQSTLLPYVKRIVTEYKDNPAIGMWEVMNEPGGADNNSIASFENGMGQNIKAIDSNHLVESGTQPVWGYNGGGNSDPTGWKQVNSSPYVDVTSMHEYDFRDQGNIISSWFAPTMQASKDLNKPMIVGESGINANQAGCTVENNHASITQRAAYFRQKFDAYFNGGAAATIMYQVKFGNVDEVNGCDDSFLMSDPSFTQLKTYTFPGGIPNGGSSVPAETTPPTLSITAPAAGATVTGDSVPVTVSAADNSGGSGMSKVDYYLDSATSPFKTISGTGPYNFRWDASTVGNGRHTLKAVASDVAGNTTTKTVTVTVTGSSTLTSYDDTLVGTGSNQFNYVGSGWATSSDSVKYDGTDHYDKTAGDTMTFSFSGTQVKLYGATANYYGNAAFSIDGGSASTVDLYAADRTDQALLWASPTLSAGTHTVTVRILGTHDANSGDSLVSIDRADVISGDVNTSNALSGDINNDGHVNTIDLSIILTHDNTNYAPADLNHDGVVGSADLAILLAHWKW